MSTLAVTRLELRRLFVRPLGWVLAGLSLAWLGWNFTLLLGRFLAGQIKLAALPDGPGYTDLVAVPLLALVAQLAFLLIPLLSMNAVAGERRGDTLPLLFSSGLPGWQIVLGKYLALLAWLVPWLALALAMPLSLAPFVQLDWGKLAAASLGLLLLLGSLAALGLACSAFASHPAIAAVASLLLTLMLWTINLGAQWAGVDGGAVNWLAMSSHLQPLLRGLVDSTDLAWFILLTVLALGLASHRVASERERG